MKDERKTREQLIMNWRKCANELLSWEGLVWI